MLTRPASGWGGASGLWLTGGAYATRGTTPGRGAKCVRGARAGGCLGSEPSGIRTREFSGRAGYGFRHDVRHAALRAPGRRARARGGRPWRSRPSLRARRPNRTLSPSPDRSGPPPSHRSRRWRATTTSSLTPCGGFQCADLRVPIDYDNPAGGDIAVKVLKARAANPARGSARSSSTRRASVIRRAVRQVGRLHRRARRALGLRHRRLRPRGVGQSAPIDRLSDGALDDFLGTDPTPDDDAEEQDLLAAARALASGCEANNRELLAHVSTETRPRTWTSCARPSVTASSTTWASPTAPSSARPTRTCSPSGSAGSSSTVSSHPT